MLTDPVERRTILKTMALTALAYPLNTQAEPTSETLDSLFMENLLADPTTATQFGYRQPNGVSWNRWTVRDDAWSGAAIARLTRHRGIAAKDRTSGPLDRALFDEVALDSLERLRWRHRDYIFWNNSAPHIRAFSSMIAFQPVTSIADAEAYVERVEDIARLARQEFSILRTRNAEGVSLPRFNYIDMTDSANEASRRSADPYNHPVLIDFVTKARHHALPDESIDQGQKSIAQILIKTLAPLFARQAREYASEAHRSLGDRGIWAIPDGEAYYASQIGSHTTLKSTSPEEIHRFGLEEVARLISELRMTGVRLGLSSDRPRLFAALRTDRRFRYPDSEAGREQALADVREAIDQVLIRQTEITNLPLGASIDVRPVDDLAAPSAGRAFYTEPGAHGAPGIFFLNVRDMGNNPRYQMRAVVHHEAMPGHHLQAAVLVGRPMPLFRRHLYINAFAEGWALYAEKMAGELGLYPEPADEAGRVALELFRSVRLVVDTGIHHYRWSFDKALSYMNNNCVNSESDNLAEVKRYFNWPAQALGYKMGMREILNLRRMAQQQLGNRYSAPAFHDLVLKDGAVPLRMLRDRVCAWLQAS